MNADAFRHVYDYHFAENRRLWDAYVCQLTEDQFTQPGGYSHGSVRDQLVHLISVDDTWFSGLQAREIPEPLDPAGFTRDTLRTHWELVEARMRAYLATLRDEMLFEKPFPEGGDQDLIFWQVLLQVINHGTDHRAQILRLISDLGVKTTSQDYIFYAYENP